MSFLIIESFNVCSKYLGGAVREGCLFGLRGVACYLCSES